jgi:hypothetical protein
MSDIREFVDDFIAFIRAECRDLWTKWCDLADKVVPSTGVLLEQHRSLFSDANGSIAAQSGVIHRGKLYWNGRSKEQAGEMLFSERGWHGQTDSVLQLIVHYNLYGDLRALTNEFGERLLAALHKRTLSLKGYTDDSEERTAPPRMIALDALLRARISNNIKLANKSELSHLWLEPAPQEPQRADIVSAEAPSAKILFEKTPAKRVQVIEASRAMYDDCEKAGKKPPNKNEANTEVRARLERDGYYARWKDAEDVLEFPEFRNRRRGHGRRWHKRTPR